MNDVELLRSLRSRAGEAIYSSDWFTIEQSRVDEFSRVTGDWARQHNDPEYARSGIFKGTIVHGFLLLSLIPEHIKAAGIPTEASPALRGVNYGSDRVRFPNHVLVGSSIRLHIQLIDFDEPTPERMRITLRCTIEVEESDKPALSADSIFMYFLSNEPRGSAD